MKLSIWSGYYMESGPEGAVKRFIENGIYCSELSDEHGFELLSRSDNFLKTAKEFSNFLKENNFEISQGHLWLKIRICSDETAIQKLYSWVDMYEAIGIKNMVLHCDNMVDSSLSRNEKIEKNIEKLRLLAEHIKDKDVTICLENLRPHSPQDEDLVDRNADDLLYIIERIGSDKFGICLDTGHLNLTDGNPREFILKAGNKLKALHIADNQGETDQHLMPLNGGTVNFFEVVKALREIGYKGIFNLEIPGEKCGIIKMRDEKIKTIISNYNLLMNS